MGGVVLCETRSGGQGADLAEATTPTAHFERRWFRCVVQAGDVVHVVAAAALQEEVEGDGLARGLCESAGAAPHCPPFVSICLSV